MQGLRDTRIKQVRHYSHKDPLTLDIISQRVLLVLKLYDKIETAKVSKINVIFKTSIKTFPKIMHSILSKTSKSIERFNIKSNQLVIFLYDINIAIIFSANLLETS